MSTCLLIIDDGREDYLDRCLASAAVNLPPMDACVMVSDPDHELGFAGAIQAGWDGVLETGCEFVFHLESDFTFNRPVMLDAMRGALIANPHLVQMALLRQPWNEQEKAAGGIVAMHPGDYERAGRWLEHRRNFTTNPSLYPRWVCERGWPQRSESEGHFGIDLIAGDESLRFAYWGDGSEWVTHIGVARAGTGY